MTKPKAKRARADALVVARGLAPDLSQAAALIMAGEVIAGEHRVDKPGAQLKADAPLRLRPREGRFVSRGGHKLDGALRGFGVDPRGMACVDLGASTGGFTDCLLQRGAARVYAVDVGYNLLHWRLRQDPRVINLERTDARALGEHLSEPVELLVADISFNALARVLAPALGHLRPGGEAILLIKPQFELARSEVEAGGIVRDEALRRAACDRVAAALEALGLTTLAVAPAALKGTKGNQEYVLHGRWGEAARPPSTALTVHGAG